MSLFIINVYITAIANVFSHLPKIKNSCLVEIIYLLWGARKKAWVAFRAASCHANNW